MFIRYCNCSRCIRGEQIPNPYPLYENQVSLSEVTLEFDYRTTALCRYDCNKFGKKPTCPPNIPQMEYYRRIFSECSTIAVIGRKYPYSDGNFQNHWRSYSTNEIHDLLLNKEKALFKEGRIYAKAFIGGSCKACPTDSCNSHRCSVPGKGRVPLEATGLNVYVLMKSFGLEYQEPPVDYFWRLGVVLF